MRDLILSATILGMLPVILRYPACGVLTWAWFSILSPHQEVFGFAQGKPFGLAISVVTLGGWLISRERKRWTPDATPWLMAAFLAWITFDSFFAVFPWWSWPLWNRTIRIFVFVFLVFFMVTTKARIHGLVWVLVISIGFYAVKGGIFTITSGGGGIVYGPPDTILNDNNQLALAAVMTLPLVGYLRLQTRSRWLRAGLLAASGCEMVMVFGSYSRGGVIALAVALLLSWWRGRNKARWAVLGLLVVGGGLSVMPASFWDRMATIQHASQDASFEGRLDAWHVATQFALDHFPFGAGFAGCEVPAIFNHYLPEAAAHAAHSIYFEVLGDHGVPALALYLAILAMGLRNTTVVVRQTRGRPGFRWAYDLARAMQVSLVSFYIGGAALSMAYFDALLALLAMLSTLRELTKPAPSALPVSRFAARRPQPAAA